MIPRSLQQVFAALQAQPEGTTYSVQCSFVELYLAHTRDLLGAEARSHDGKLIAPDRQLRDGKGGVYIVDLAKRPLKSVEDAILAIKDGTRHRMVAEMNMNKRSSRGHAILCAAPPMGEGGRTDTPTACSHTRVRPASTRWLRPSEPPPCCLCTQHGVRPAHDGQDRLLRQAQFGGPRRDGVGGRPAEWRLEQRTIWSPTKACHPSGYSGALDSVHSLACSGV